MGEESIPIVSSLLMRRFFIELLSPFQIPDLEGELYRNADDARADAIKFLGEVLADYDRTIAPGDEWRMIIRDERTEPICVLTLTAS